jgi:glucose/arabinose dehydrogenase
VYVEDAPGFKKLLFVVDLPGRISVLRGGKPLARPFLDITDQVSFQAEDGLFSVAFDPDYKRSRRFYVYYVDNAGDLRIDEFKRRRGSTTVANPNSQRNVLAIGHPTFSNHNGGQLQFGPDGKLWLATGDGGGGGDGFDNARDTDSLLGKLLRIDPTSKKGSYGVPRDNPYVGRDGADEIYAYGLRNPWRFSFDRLTGDLWIADVGQEEFEEIDFVPAAEVGELLNFGWDAFEGSAVYEDKEPSPGGRLVQPISEYTHEFGCSVTGGFVYRGSDVAGEARGRYFYGDYCTGRVWSLGRWRGEVMRRGQMFRVPQLSSFAEDADGELYLVSQGGTIYRLAPR